MHLITALRVEIQNNLDYIFELENELNRLNSLLTIISRQSIINYSQRIVSIKNKISLEKESVNYQQKLLQELILN